MRHRLAQLAISALWFSAAARALDLGDAPDLTDNQTTAPASAPATPPSSDSIFKLPSWLQLSGQIRGRFEDISGANVTNNISDAYYLSRIRIAVGVRPASWLRFFVQAQDQRVFDYNTSPLPNTVYNPIDLRQAYVEVSSESAGVSFRAGRQDLIFGAERLIGASDWGISRTFDALDLTVKHGRAKVDLFAASVVLINTTGFDEHKPGEHLYGAYGSVSRVLPGMNVEPYLLFKQTLNVTGENGVFGDAMAITPGVRVFGKAPERLDYAVEIAAQRGYYSGDQISALAGSYVVGWTVNSSELKPRFSAEYDHASGDSNNKDDVRQTFDQLYPTNHSYYGIADQMGWKNMRNPRAGFDFQPMKKVTLRADFNEFYLANTQDGLYNSSGTRIVLNRKASSRHVGSEADFIAFYRLSKTWTFGAGYGHLFPGEYLKQSKFPFGYTYPYLMFMMNL